MLDMGLIALLACLAVVLILVFMTGWARRKASERLGSRARSYKFDWRACLRIFLISSIFSACFCAIFEVSPDLARLFVLLFTVAIFVWAVLLGRSL